MRADGKAAIECGFGKTVFATPTTWRCPRSLEGDGGIRCCAHRDPDGRLRLRRAPVRRRHRRGSPGRFIADILVAHPARGTLFDLPNVMTSQGEGRRCALRDRRAQFPRRRPGADLARSNSAEHAHHLEHHRAGGGVHNPVSRKRCQAVDKLPRRGMLSEPCIAFTRVVGTGRLTGSLNLPIKRECGGEHGDWPVLAAGWIGHRGLRASAHRNLLRSIQSKRV